jgi:lipoprotein NlpD
MQEPTTRPASIAPPATPGSPAPEVPAQPIASAAQQVAVAAPTPAAQQGEAASRQKSGDETFTGEKVAAWRWPTSGPVIRGYSESVHKGIDIGGARGDAVTAVASGKVVYAGTGIAGFGELLIIKHNDVYLSAYGHNDELLVAEGDSVVAGQTIAQKGSSGTDAVKLHFEIRQEGKPIDPLRLLPGR